MNFHPSRPTSALLRAMKSRQNRPSTRKRKPRERATLPSKKRSRQFLETPLGYKLAYYAPVEYQLIVVGGGKNEPDPDFIEAMSYIFKHPWFRTTEFRLALAEYRQYRLRGEPYIPGPREKLKMLHRNHMAFTQSGYVNNN